MNWFEPVQTVIFTLRSWTVFFEPERKPERKTFRFDTLLATSMKLSWSAVNLCYDKTPACRHVDSCQFPPVYVCLYPCMCVRNSLHPFHPPFDPQPSTGISHGPGLRDRHFIPVSPLSSSRSWFSSHSSRVVMQLVIFCMCGSWKAIIRHTFVLCPLCTPGWASSIYNIFGLLGNALRDLHFMNDDELKQSICDDSRAAARHCMFLEYSVSFTNVRSAKGSVTLYTNNGIFRKDSAMLRVYAISLSQCLF